MNLSGASNLIFVLCFFFCLLFSQAAFSQDFSSLDSDLLQLENLINDTITITQEQLKLLESLSGSLAENGILIDNYERIIYGQENLLRELHLQLNEMSETYRMQSSLSASYAKTSKFWRTFTIIAIPVTALISGAVGWAISR